LGVVEDVQVDVCDKDREGGWDTVMESLGPGTRDGDTAG
jgi:hypothetical protein